MKNNRYPDRVDLTPGTQVHEDLVTHLMRFVEESYRYMSRRYSQWSKIDNTLTAYIPLDEAEQKVKALDGRKPVTIVVPETFATLETLLTYNVAAFLNSPIFQYDPVGPEDVVGTKLMELVNETHTRRNKVALKLHTLWRDGYAYGRSASGITWTVREGYRTKKGDNLLQKLMSSLGGQKEVIFEGNDLVNIDMYKYFPDPRVSAGDVQSGRFVAWLDSANYLDMMSEERLDESYFNIEYLKDNKYRGKSRYNSDSSTGREDKFGGYTDLGERNNIVDSIYIYAKIIPKDLKLGKGTDPEKWFFRISSDKVITAAMPMGLNHDMFPVVESSPLYDGHTPTPVSPLEMIFGLQETLDWLFRSHVTNIRKAIHDMWIVDPQSVNVYDITTPSPGKIIRLRRSAWGRGVKDVIQQFPVTDVTRQHIQDTGVIKGMMQEVSSATDIVKGIGLRNGDRVTATEVSASTRAALSRLQKMARLTALQAHHDIAYMFAVQTQQFMSNETYVKMVGRVEQDFIEEYRLATKMDRGFYRVKPSDLDIGYDVKEHDGSTIGSTDVQAWSQLFTILAQNPLIGSQFDTVRVFKHIARGLGATNINDFIKAVPMQTRVMPNEQVEQQARQGNLVPVEGL